jgi:DNA-binding response OmpR family regulator
VAAGDHRERRRIVATIASAGFSVTEAADPRGAMAALKRHDFAAIVLASRSNDCGQFLRRARLCRPAPRIIFVPAPAAMPPPEAGGATIVNRPLDPRRLLAAVFELVLRDERPDDARDRRDAELGIAAAQLACLDRRCAAAERSGSGRLARDLRRRIGEVQSTSRALFRGTLGG